MTDWSPDLLLSQVCSVCKESLNDWYFEKEGVFYCKRDYWIKFGDLCQSCCDVITGPVMVAGDHKFHPECFRCSKCGAFIGDGESYALIDRSKLFCGECYQKQIQLLNRTPFSKKPHSIQLIEVPALPEGLKRCIKLTFSRSKGENDLIKGKDKSGVYVSQLGINTDLIELQVGDKILEVNGSPIAHQSLPDIEELIGSANKVLHLTIEHDPSANACPQKTLSFTNDNEKLDLSDKERDRSNSSSAVITPTKNGSSTPDELQVDVSGGRLSRSNTKRNTNRERSSSLPRLLSSQLSTPSSDDLPDCHSNGHNSEFVSHATPLSRTKSFRVETKNYRIFRASDLVKGNLLGKGFFGEVFLVTHRQTNEKMVLKELYRVEEEAESNFLKEVAVLRSLNHKNVLHFIGVLYRDKRLHLLTEFISGGTLKELIQDMNRPLSWKQRIDFAKDIASGMAYLHSMNIIHRDLNSQNCLVREDGTVVVADFGLAKVITSSKKYSNGKRRDRRKRYTVVGNPYWMAPEMMKGKKYDEKVDVFSFGIVLCEIIGRVQADPDYLPRNSDFGLNKVVFKEKFCDTCPEPFTKIAFLCTEVDPENRPPFEVLERWLSNMSLHFGISPTLTIPKELMNEINSFTDHSLSSLTPESTPETRRAHPNSQLRTISEHIPDI